MQVLYTMGMVDSVNCRSRLVDDGVLSVSISSTDVPLSLASQRLHQPHFSFGIAYPFDVSPRKKTLPLPHKKCPGSIDTGHFDVSV
ncbi:hypothetical protein HZ99_26260 [Pseudomonas fluorescens]|nr:hypothetical protein HZ99_26260 [Pseudomonas fluorescens]